MTTATIAPQRTESRGTRHGFSQLVHAEWTKFRTIRGWVIGMILAALLTVFLGIFAAANVSTGCQINNGPVRTGKACLPYIPHGPGGDVVKDSFNFAHQQLAGNGSITAQITSLTGSRASFNGPQTGQGPNLVPGLMPWSKAGIIIKANTKQGSAYAAMLVSGSHGVRMQYNYTNDVGGLPGSVSAAHPRWLRLTRSGDTITGYDSADGTHWTQVGTARLAGLPKTVLIGMFATSPNYVQTQTSFGGGSSGQIGPSQATGVFDDVSLLGGSAGARWTDSPVGNGGPLSQQGPAGPVGIRGASGAAGFKEAAGKFTLTGSGDIAPVVPNDPSGLPTTTIEQPLAGLFVGLIAIVVVAAMFFTTEYRRGLIRTTLAAAPRRGQVLAAKAIVIGLVAFLTGLVAVVVAIVVGVPRLSNGGQVVLPVSVLTEARVIVGTAALVGVVAVFAAAVGAIFRRSAAAITVAILAVVMPFLLTALNVFPSNVGDWILRVTPAAGLAIEQSIPHYSQVTSVASAVRGSYPLPPLAGFAVLCCWAVAAVILALILLRRRDA